MARLFIFIGRSGCGKGTQAALLKSWLAEPAGAAPIIHIETGKLFRSLAAQSEIYTSHLIEAGIARGDRLPDFLSVWNWARVLVDNFHGTENIIMDGAPRSLAEAQMFDTLVRFYSDLRPTVIYLNLSRASAKARMESRGRSDDVEAGVEHRLDWFEKEVVPAIEHFRESRLYQFVDLDAEPDIETIHQRLIAEL